ncbi:hypothetical protein EU528_12995 [Candidatus Thorarchaeota archaeon]|nr:MAG: hypothetical protein EU528_12995 [Candidatus Thorarchaeota archaeon]
MKTRNIIIAVLVISIISVGTIVVLNPNLLGSGTLLHYERVYTGEKPVMLIVGGLKDCVLTLGYEDNEDLMYRIDVELYDSSETIYFEYRGNGIGDYQHFIDINTGSHWGSTTRAKTMNITLGSGHAYYISLGGDSNSANVTGNIVFDNNATLGGEEFAYLFPGTLNLVFTEDIDYSQGGLDMDIGKDNEEISSVNMYIDLPDGMDGHAIFRSESMSISTTGWTMYKQTVSPPEKWYRTSESPTKPLLDIDKVFGDSIMASLLN